MKISYRMANSHSDFSRIIDQLQLYNFLILKKCMNCVFTKVLRYFIFELLYMACGITNSFHILKENFKTGAKRTRTS